MALLSDFADIVMGQSPAGNSCYPEEIGIPLLNGPTEFASYHPVPTQWTDDPKRKASTGDLLFCVRGSTTGRMNWADQEYAIGRGLAAIRHRKGGAYQAWIRGVIEAQLAELLSAATGSTFPNVSKDQLRALEVPEHSIVEQREIAAILGALDDKIELNRKTSVTLEAMARALYRSWFVDFDPVHARAEGRTPAHMDPATAALFPDSFGEDGLPEGWGLDSMANFMDIKGGTQPPKSEFRYLPAIGFTRLVQIRDYETDQHPTFVRDSAGLRKCNKLDVMIGRYGASVGRICWGMDGVYNVALVKAEPLNSGDQEFVRSACLSYEFQDYIQAISGRSAQSGFNKGDIAAFELVGATPEIRNAFNVQVNKIRLIQLQRRMQNQTLATLRDTLLPRLMSGELRVGAARAEVEALA